MQIVEKHKLALRWFHWVNFPVLGLMIWSGLLIYWANDVYGIWWNPSDRWHIDQRASDVLKPDQVLGAGDLVHLTQPIQVFHFFPSSVYDSLHLSGSLATGMAWHFTLMWLFMLNGLLYVLWIGFSRHWRELFPGKGAFKESLLVVLHDLHLTKKKPPERKFNAAQQFAYTSVIAMGVGSTLTGLAILRPAQLGWLTALLGGYEFARGIHFVLTLFYLVFFVVHVTQVIRAGWNNFRAMLTGYELVPTPPANE